MNRPTDTKREPPGWNGRPLGGVLLSGFDTPRDNPPVRKTQARPIGPVAAQVVADLRFRRQVERLHRLGDRVLTEFLAEIAVERGITTIIDRKLATYVDLDPAALEAGGGDTFWPVPLRGVGDG